MAKDIIVVIDPGHGGENEGALWNDYVEKEMTLKVAKAMKEELDKYEGVSVYLTREEDEELSLKERIDIADDLGADFVFCLHFNMSVEHTLYGAECWISAFDRCYARANDFSKIEMQELTGLGLFDRGIKTRISSKTGKDYYGVIRCGEEKEIPTVIIEHCHLDHENDETFMNLDTWPEAYGRLDATAVAKYYGLKSEEIGVDYSGYQYERTPVPDSPVYPDSTPPDYCNVRLFEIDEYTGIASVELEAHDEETDLMYYTYSLDGGESFATYLPWPRGDERVNFNIIIPENQDCSIVFAVDNMYNLETCSEIIEVDAFSYKVDEIEEEIIIEEKPEIIFTEVKVESAPKKNTNITGFVVLELAVLVALLLTGSLIVLKTRRR